MRPDDKHAQSGSDEHTGSPLYVFFAPSAVKNFFYACHIPSPLPYLSSGGTFFPADLLSLKYEQQCRTHPYLNTQAWRIIILRRRSNDS
jgi:hypothetical protein